MISVAASVRFITHCILIIIQEDMSQQAMNKFSLRYDDVETAVAGSGKTAAQSPVKVTISTFPAKTSLQVSKKHPVPNPPPLVNPQLLSTNPVPPSAFLMAAAAAGMFFTRSCVSSSFYLFTREKHLGLIIHSSSWEHFL